VRGDRWLETSINQQQERGGEEEGLMERVTRERTIILPQFPDLSRLSSFGIVSLIHVCITGPILSNINYKKYKSII